MKTSNFSLPSKKVTRRPLISSSSNIILDSVPTPCQYVNFDNSEEIVQEIMIWLWENRNMIKIESSPIPYLFRAVRNNCLRQKNRDELKNKILTILYNHTNTPYDNPNFYIEEELIRKIEKSIQDLPENYRQAFEMNRFQDMTYKEIASHLNISSKTVDYRIQQA